MTNRCMFFNKRIIIENCITRKVISKIICPVNRKTFITIEIWIINIIWIRNVLQVFHHTSFVWYCRLYISIIQVCSSAKSLSSAWVQTQVCSLGSTTLGPGTAALGPGAIALGPTWTQHRHTSTQFCKISPGSAHLCGECLQHVSNMSLRHNNVSKFWWHGPCCVISAQPVPIYRAQSCVMTVCHLPTIHAYKKWREAWINMQMDTHPIVALPKWHIINKTMGFPLNRTVTLFYLC